MPSLSHDRDGFALDGQPFRILSGALHYFRVVPEQWDARLALLRAMGLNTVETYVAWNLHEPRPGQYDFTGRLDLERFITAAAGHGLKVLVRPGPYICAEWEFGGLPAWLLKDPAIRLRCSHPGYLAAVDRWFDALLPRIVPHLAEQGGPVIALQVENEYGSYANDAAYLRHLAQGLRRRGAGSLLFTSDGPTDAMLQGGTMAGVLPTANFGDRAADSFEVLRRYSPDGPPVCMEYWNGWFDHWGERHHTRDAADAAKVLDEMLAAGASVNLYMAHGGTNFGYLNGANLEDGRLRPTVTSYDYDAAISESGEPTEKFWAFREVLGRYTELPPAPVVAAAERLAPGCSNSPRRSRCWNCWTTWPPRSTRPPPSPWRSSIRPTASCSTAPGSPARARRRRCWWTASATGRRSSWTAGRSACWTAPSRSWAARWRSRPAEPGSTCWWRTSAGSTTARSWPIARVSRVESGWGSSC